MQKKQSAKLARHNAIASFFQNNMTLVNSWPGFAAAAETYRTKLASLNATVELDKKVVTGITKDVRTSKKKLARQFAGNAALIRAMAHTTGNLALADTVNFSESDLFTSRNEDINKHCANILNAARTHVAELKDYGVDQTSIAAMDASLLSYNSKTSAPRNARSEKHSYILSIDQQLDDLDDMLDNVLNNFVVPFKNSNPDFYNAYQSNRKIVDISTSHSQLRGNLTDNSNSKIIAGVYITVVLNGTTYIARTNKSGNYFLNIPEVGSCEVTATHPGYENSGVLTADISLGKKTVLDIELKKKNITVATSTPL